MYRYIKAFIVLWLGLTALPAAGSDVRYIELDPARTKYRIDCVKLDQRPVGTRKRLNYLMCKLDGDGMPEYVGGRFNKILGFDGEDGKIKPRWQMNVDPGFSLHQRTPRLGAAADFDGDGIDEIFTTTVARDRSSWHFLTIDAATGSVTLDVELPLGTDRRPDGIWDGHYIAAGTLEDADGKGRPGVVLLRNIEYDANPRGVAVIDPFNGEIIWEWKCGPNPDIDSPVVADLDGDGDREIIIYGHSPDNLGGVKVNGTSDDQAILFVLDNRGELLWQREIGPAFTAGSLHLDDLDGDGIQEIIAFTRGMPVNSPNKMMIWDGKDGRLICQTRRSAGFIGVVSTPGPREGTGWVFAGSDDGVIDRFLFDGSSLVRDRRVLRDEPYCVVVGALDVLPEEGLEILVDVEGGTLFGVLNRDLEPLAATADFVAGPKTNPSLWKSSAGVPYLVLGNEEANWILDFQKVPRNYLAMAQMAGYALLVAGIVAGVFLLGLRRGRMQEAGDRTAGNGTRSADREVLYRLWRQLDDIRHEKMLEASRGLRRLVWLLDAYATDMGSSGDLSERIRQLMGDYTEVVRPRLEGILQLARGENFEIGVVEGTEEALGSLSRLLEGLTSDNMNVTKVSEGRAEMNRELEEVEKGLMDLWESLRDYFSTDPVRMLEGLLLVREGEFIRSRIVTDFEGAEGIADAACLIDSGDLRYVLDNLVDNAVRSMENSTARRLMLRVERKDSEISLHVSDTGCGIPREIRDKIFSGRFSTRHGGGNGLFRSREVLRRWGGEITLADSSPDKGTTFIVLLRAAHKPENGVAPKAGEARA